jgi:Holliday junction resolvase RusA-like endonuclease
MTDPVRIRIEHPVQAYVRQTQRSKHASPKARAYNENQAALAMLIETSCRQQDIEPYDKAARLHVEVLVARAPESRLIIPVDGKSYRRVTHPAQTCDVDNFGKAVLDACQKSGLIPNDKQVWKARYEKAETQGPDYFTVAIRAIT